MTEQRQDDLPVLRVVADTSFYVAALLSQGYAFKYVSGNNSKYMRYQLFTSEAILQKFQEKLEGKLFNFSRDRIVRTMRHMRKRLQIVYPHEVLQVVRDSDDNKILECAVEAEADIVISSDSDLLSLKEFQGMKIIHPSDLKYLLPLQ